MADTLVREAIAYGSQQFSPVPCYWDGASYVKAQGINGAIRVINYNSAGETFTAANPAILTVPVVGSANNTWSANATISAGATSTAVDLRYNYQISYFGSVTNTASLTLSLQVSQDNSNWYTAANNTITAGTTSPFHYSATTGARYAKLTASGVSATITATIAGK